MNGLEMSGLVETKEKKLSIRMDNKVSRDEIPWKWRNRLENFSTTFYLVSASEKEGNKKGSSDEVYVLNSFQIADAKEAN